MRIQVRLQDDRGGRSVDHLASTTARDPGVPQGPFGLDGGEPFVVELNGHGQHRAQGVGEGLGLLGSRTSRTRKRTWVAHHDRRGVVVGNERGHRFQLARWLPDVDRADRHRHAAGGIGDRDTDASVPQIEPEDAPRG